MSIERSLREPCDGFEDLIGGFRPLEWLWFVVVSIEIVLNRIAELRHARMRASSQSVFGEQAKETLSEVEPRGVCGREVKVEPRSLGKPAPSPPCLAPYPLLTSPILNEVTSPRSSWRNRSGRPRAGLKIPVRAEQDRMQPSSGADLSRVILHRE